MRINIVTSSGRTSAYTNCYYISSDHTYSSLPVPQAKGKPKPPAVRVDGGQLAFVFKLAAYKQYEADEARRVAGGAAIRELRRHSLEHMCWFLDGDVPIEHFCQFVTGALLADYQLLKYKSGTATKTSELKLTIIAGKNKASFSRELKRLTAINIGVSTARDLANTPASDLTPIEFAAFAKKMAKAEGLSYKSLSAKQIDKGGYVGLHNVGRGSVNPPVLFVLEHTPTSTRRGVKPLCLVGKGICFDAGGINLKGWDGMWDMKADMGGAAAVVGAMQVIARMNLPLHVTAVVAAAQNLPGGNAYLPSDVLRFRNGRTVEIQNTDAEGRLVLADALLYAQHVLKQHRIVDFATLTGAAAAALGPQYIALLSRASELKEQVKEAAIASGELVWELPLHPEYREMLKSSIADIRNIGKKGICGAQTAGWFLNEFIEEKTEFVHLDIAGTMACKEGKYWSQDGMSGSGTRLAAALAELCCDAKTDCT